MKNNRKKLFLSTVVICILLISLLIGVQYLASFQNVTLKPPQKSKITLYKGVDDGEENVNYDKNNIVLTTTETTSKKIRKGYYVYVLEPQNSDYKTQVVPIDIKDTSVSISPGLELTEAKLNTLAQAEKANINQVLQAKYPQTMQFYSTDKVAAFTSGEWFGVSLKPKTSNFDTVVAVFKKDNNGLSLKTTPSIILSQPVYPDIPKDVLSSANRLAQTY